MQDRSILSDLSLHLYKLDKINPTMFVRYLFRYQTFSEKGHKTNDNNLAVIQDQKRSSIEFKGKNLVKGKVERKKD